MPSKYLTHIGVPIRQRQLFSNEADNAMALFLDFPFHIDGRGRSAETEEDDHIRDMIMQVLFTDPGERVNRPDFGCGLKQLVFMPNSDALATATQFLVQGSLQRWLEAVIQVETVEVEAVDSELRVLVVYSKRSGGGLQARSLYAEWSGLERRRMQSIVKFGSVCRDVQRRADILRIRRSTASTLLSMNDVHWRSQACAGGNISQAAARPAEFQSRWRIRSDVARKSRADSHSGWNAHR